ncbi:hypothetical protein BDV59DRAFT_134116 [Aspergillus ambiguus]|uniref:uncharacterized protein n=1 Tax=Aspergillus ambiguus TaxID=176160 RepID=UPI003CCDDF4E
MESEVHLSDRINNAGKSYTAAIVAIVCCAFSGLLVLLRFAEKIRIRSILAEDYTILPGFLLYIFSTILIIRANTEGAIGTPIDQPTLPQVRIVLQAAVLVYWVYIPMTTFMRISILLFYRRLFSTPMPVLGVVIWVILGVQVILFIVATILPATGPEPLYLMLHLRVATRDPADGRYFYVVGTATLAISLTFDITLLVLPLFPVVSLRLPLRKRVGMVILFMLGAAACFAAAWRLQTFLSDLKDQIDTSKWLNTPDGYYVPIQHRKAGATLNYWYATLLEPAVALSGTSLPAIRHMICSIRKNTSPAPSERRELSDRSAGSSRQHHHGGWLSLHHIRTSERALMAISDLECNAL